MPAHKERRKERKGPTAEQGAKRLLDDSWPSAADTPRMEQERSCRQRCGQFLVRTGEKRTVRIHDGLSGLFARKQRQHLARALNFFMPVTAQDSGIIRPAATLPNHERHQCLERRGAFPRQSSRQDHRPHSSRPFSDDFQPTAATARPASPLKPFPDPSRAQVGIQISVLLKTIQGHEDLLPVLRIEILRHVPKAHGAIIGNNRTHVFRPDDLLVCHRGHYIIISAHTTPHIRVSCLSQSSRRSSRAGNRGFSRSGDASRLWPVGADGPRIIWYTLVP